MRFTSSSVLATVMEARVRLTSRTRRRRTGFDSKRERTRSRVSVTSGDIVDDGLGTTWPANGTLHCLFASHSYDLSKKIWGWVA